MKIFPFFLFLFPLNVYAQSISKVSYESTIHIEHSNEIPSNIDLPSKRVQMFDLIFNEDQSLYVKDLEFKDPNMDEHSRRWRRGDKPHELYHDFSKNEQKERVSFFRKEFLVSDSIENLQWKIAADEHRDIHGYTTMKAILVDTSKMVEAWFTPQIPASVGPEIYHGLPGLILAVTIDENRVILATKIELGISDVKIEMPTKGKKMKKAEFTVLKEEKSAEMKKMWGNSKRRWRNR